MVPLHTCTAARSQSYPFLVPCKPRVRRRLPQQVFDHLEAGRSRNEPYHYTSGDVQAIATHVSCLAHVDQLQADLNNLSTARNHAPLPTRHPRHEARIAFQKHRAELKDELQTIRTQREQQNGRTLEERLARPKLADCITEPTYTPIAPKPIVIDFNRVNAKDLIGIFKPEIATTVTRLKPIIELADHWENATSDQRRTFESLTDKIQSFGFDLEQRAPAVTHAQWQSLDWGLKEIGKVSFVGLCRNYQSVLSRLVVLSGQGYFEWL